MPIMPDIPKAEAAIIEQTNAFRASSKLQAVASEPRLAKAARDFAQFLGASTKFSHEADGRRPIDRIKAAGYGPCTAAENLAWQKDTRGFETMQLANLLVDGWKKSPGHRKNLLAEHATQTGVAIVKARREEKYFAVQLFARPDSLRYGFTIENATSGAVNYAIGDQPEAIERNTLVSYTPCIPAEIVFQLKAPTPTAKAVTARYETRDGLTFRLSTSKDGQIVVEVNGK